MKKVIIVTLIIMILLIVPQKKKINYIHHTYAYDTSKKEIAVGASSYVFVCKINKISDTKYINDSPYTIYEATVTKNIKGTLEKNIILNQYGGKNKDNTYTFVENGGYLKENTFYIILAETINGQLEVSDPNRIIELNSKNEQTIIKEYIKAYQNEEIPINNSGENLSNDETSIYDKN